MNRGGVDPIGAVLSDIPDGWRVARLGYETWVRARLGWKGLTADEYVDDGYVFLSTPNIKGREIDFENVNYISEERFFESPEIILHEGDVLLTKDGSTIGITNLVKRLSRPATVNGSIAVLTPRGDLTSQYLRYVLESDYGQSLMDRLKGGMGVPHLFQWDISRMEVPCPPSEEQRVIADFLNRETAQIDAMVDAQARLVSLLIERREAAITAAVTVDDGAFGGHASGTTWYQSIPRDWLLSRVAGLVEVLTDGAHVSPDTADGVYDFVSTRDIRDGQIDFDGALKTSAETYEYMVRTGCRPLPGDVLFSKDGTVGRTALVKDARNFVVASSLIIVRPRGSVATSAFLNYAFQSRNFQEQVLAFVRGAGLPRVSVSNFGKAVVLLPPLDEQEPIVAQLDAATARIDAMIDKAQKSIALMKERRAALISAAVTGRIDVRTGIERVGRDLEEAHA